MASAWRHDLPGTTPARIIDVLSSISVRAFPLRRPPGITKSVDSPRKTVSRSLTSRLPKEDLRGPGRGQATDGESPSLGTGACHVLQSTHPEGGRARGPRPGPRRRLWGHVVRPTVDPPPGGIERAGRLGH